MVQSYHMKIINRHFRRDYEVVDSFEAGIMLSGPEVKSIRSGNFKLEQAFGKIIDGEMFLFNAEIPSYSFSSNSKYQPARMRKLLLHKKELIKIESKLKSGGRLTIIPEMCYTKGRHIKMSIAICKGRGEIAKKKIERAEDIRQAQRKEMKEFLKK